HAAGAAYNGFNLVIGDPGLACYTGNRDGQPGPTNLAPGRYIISNHLLDTPWPKAQRLRLALDVFPLERLDASLAPIFDILKDNTPAQDRDLPETGLPRDRERLLSSPLIVSPGYGTRCSTVIAV